MPGAIAAALASQLVSVLPGLVIGNLFGETALASFQVVSPWLYAVGFLLTLLSSGAAINYGEAMGAIDRERCRVVFSSGFYAAIGVGLGLAIAAVLLSTRTAAWNGLEGEIARMTTDCWRGYSAVFLVLPVSAYLKSMVCADGDSALGSISVVAELVVGVVAMLVLGRLYGLFGSLIGLFAGTLVGLLVAALHFFKERNSLKFTMQFSVREILSACIIEFPEASVSLFLALMTFIATVVWKNSFGVASLGIIPVVFGLDALFVESAFPVAAQPLVNVYLGDRNPISARGVLMSATRLSIVIGTAYCIVLELFPEAILRLYGITSPDMLALGVPSLRIAALNYPLVGLTGILINHYQVIRRPALSQLLVFLRCGLFPIGMMVLLTPSFGIAGFWFGYAFMCLGALLCLWMLIALSHETKGFPFFIDVSGAWMRVWTVRATEEDAVAVSKNVFDALRAHGAPPEIVGKASVLAEEAVMSVRDRNPQRPPLVEVMIREAGESGMELVLRDGGRIFNLSESVEAATSMRAVLLDGMLAFSDRRDEVVTTGFNRRVYSVT